MSATAHPRPTPYAELARELLRERVLDAVGELLADHPWAQVTMAEVAQRAGVSRQTLYNIFGTRLQLAQTYLGRESDRFLTAVDAAVRGHAGDPRQALAEALETFLTAASEHPLVRALTTADGSEELLPLITTRGGPLIDHVTGHLAGLLHEIWPQLARSDASPLADALVRLAISHAALPADEPRDTARALARLLGPRVDQLLN